MFFTRKTDNKVFASSQAIREASLAVSRPTVHGPDPRRSPKQSPCGLAASGGVLNLQGNKRESRKFFRISIFDIIVLVILFLSFIIRELHLIKYPVPSRDCYEYANFILEWERAKTIPIDNAFPPVAMLIMRFPSLWGGVELIQGGIILNLVLGLANVYIICLTTKKITRSNFAVLLIGVIVATNPSLVHYSTQFLRENIFLFFCSLCILKSTELCYRYRFITLWEIAFFSTMAYLSRHEGFEMFILETIFLLFQNKYPIPTRIKRIVLYCFLCVVCFIVASWIVGAQLDYHLNTINKKYGYFWNQIN